MNIHHCREHVSYNYSVFGLVMYGVSEYVETGAANLCPSQKPTVDAYCRWFVPGLFLATLDIAQLSYNWIYRLVLYEVSFVNERRELVRCKRSLHRIALLVRIARNGYFKCSAFTVTALPHRLIGFCISCLKHMTYDIDIAENRAVLRHTNLDGTVHCVEVITNLMTSMKYGGINGFIIHAANNSVSKMKRNEDLVHTGLFLPNLAFREVPQKTKPDILT
ncbi:hypothetical protein ANN_23756 [Periplaneta americana]|uniref:Uncharacterized protein n=1 Tax=Periplaneta americana TaxID=6978 RepID=A0ABQ8SP17_PERAM|nr:hypothetical protein ANN_23756 [Periplaneta americana]